MRFGSPTRGVDRLPGPSEKCEGRLFELGSEKSVAKPQEYDVVQLLRAMPQHDLPVGSKGAVVMDHSKYADKSLPATYEVEFFDSKGVTQAVVTVYEEDLQVVSRSHY